MGLILNTWLRFNQNRHVRKITGSKITAFYAVFSIIYAAIQIILIAAAWQVNHGAGSSIELMVDGSGNGTKEFAFLDSSSGSPHIRIFFPTNGTLDVTPYDGLTVNGVRPTSTINLNQDCVQAIKWPYDNLRGIRREDIVAICFQAWLFIMSVTALMAQSIPHIGASFGVHAIALGWSSYQIWETHKFEGDYHNLISGPQGACHGIDFITGYYRTRMSYQIATTVVNIVSAIVSAYLCWRLFDTYGWATFKKMGASRTISRAYKVALALSICIQLEVFLYNASVVSYLDMIRRELFGANPRFRLVYLIGYASTTVCVGPWLCLAWYGIRRESKVMMFGFFALSVVYLVLSGAMFISDTFKATFKHWPFVAGVFSISWAFLVVIIILAIFCTLNFGKGLPHYFERRNGEEADDYSEDFHPSPDERNGDLEKVSFPSASGNSPPMYIKRSESATSHISQESHGSTRLPPLEVTNSWDMPRIAIPLLPNGVFGRSLTASPQSQAATNSSFSPSWTPGDDRAMMAHQRSLQRFDTASSFGNLDSTRTHSGLDRTFSFGTQASSNIIVPVNAPQRSLTSSSKSSVATTSSAYSDGTVGKKRRIDLGAEL